MSICRSKVLRVASWQRVCLRSKIQSETINKSDGILTLAAADALLMLLLTVWAAKKTTKIATCILRFIFVEFVERFGFEAGCENGSAAIETRIDDCFFNWLQRPDIRQISFRDFYWKNLRKMVVNWRGWIPSLVLFCILLNTDGDASQVRLGIFPFFTLFASHTQLGTHSHTHTHSKIDGQWRTNWRGRNVLSTKLRAIWPIFHEIDRHFSVVLIKSENDGESNSRPAFSHAPADGRHWISTELDCPWPLLCVSLRLAILLRQRHLMVAFNSSALTFSWLPGKPVRPGHPESKKIMN